MQSLDELGQFTCHRSFVRPPRPINIAAQEGSYFDLKKSAVAASAVVGE
jgi:hypothetical protein